MMPPNRRYSPNIQPIVSTVPSSKNSSLMRMEFRISPKISRSSASRRINRNSQEIGKLYRS
jgi:hypothetical protein